MYEWLRGERNNKSIGKIQADSQMLRFDRYQSVVFSLTFF